MAKLGKVDLAQEVVRTLNQRSLEHPSPRLSTAPRPRFRNRKRSEPS